MNTANHETMSTILLSGSLAKLFGRTHQRLIGPTREAFTALSATIPGFQKFMNTSKARGLTFAVFVDKKNVTQDDLDFPNGNRTIRIVPIIIGSKKAGILQTIMGAVLVAVGNRNLWVRPGMGRQCYGCRRFDDCWRCNPDAIPSAYRAGKQTKC